MCTQVRRARLGVNVIAGTAFRWYRVIRGELRDEKSSLAIRDLEPGRIHRRPKASREDAIPSTTRDDCLRTIFGFSAVRRGPTDETDFFSIRTRRVVRRNAHLALHRITRTHDTYLSTRLSRGTCHAVVFICTYPTLTRVRVTDGIESANTTTGLRLGRSVTTDRKYCRAYAAVFLEVNRT